MPDVPENHDAGADAAIAEALRPGVSLKALRQNHVRILVEEPEALRHHADYFARARVDNDGPPCDGAISAEATLPVSVAQDDCLGRPRCIVF